MEEVISMIFYGCKLARDLELNLPNLANQPNILSKSCDEIIRILSKARDRLKDHETTSYGHMIHREANELQQLEIGAGLQEWLRASAMNLLNAQVLHEKSDFDDVHGLPECSRMGRTQPPEAALEVFGTTGGEVQAMDVADSGRGSSSSQRLRRRKDDADNRTITVPIPHMGNMEIPPEDGYTWRKYGQKEILGTRFPRSYYRCTYQKLYQCPAKKQVQRLDNDPYTFEVLYRGDHTCTMSSMAPSAPDMTQQATITQPTPPSQSTLFPPSHWLSMDIRPSGEGIGAFPAMLTYRDFGLSGAGSSGSTMGGSSGAGPSIARFGKDVDYQPVADFADAMFNSGSSSNNSMDLIFSSMDDKWEIGGKKN